MLGRKRHLPRAAPASPRALAPSKPTLFLSECVLVYMGPEESRALVRWAGQSFSTAAWLNYDPIRPHDAFGQVMVENLKVRDPSHRAACAASAVLLIVTHMHTFPPR